MTKSKQIQINHYINHGQPTIDDFSMVETELSQPIDGEVLVKNTWMTVDPYMRGRMNDQKSYIPPFELNAPLQGGAVGIVEVSNSNTLHKGDLVLSDNGWRDYFTAPCKTLLTLNPIEHPEYYLGILGMPGLTAYGGLLTIGKPLPGETVFVSAGSGAVGSIVCQIAKLKGCTVIASCGSDEKCQWLENTCGVDKAFNYKKTTSLNTTLKEAAPEGIDVYFDNVGGEHLEAAINAMNLHGRIVVCGMISQYNADKPQPGPNNLMWKSLDQI